MNNKSIILEVKKVCKSFPGVKALINIDLELKKGEVLGILGENGAGKSTLINILSGIYKKDSGDIYIDGEKKEINSPNEAKVIGIRVIHQELNLLEYLTVSENIFMGELPMHNILPIVDWKKVRKNAKEVLTKLKIDLDPDKRVGELTVAQKQIVEIAKAVVKNSRILIMDEPSAALGDEEIEALFDIMKELKKSGVTIIYITHKIVEIFKITDRVCVLRDGKKVGVVKTSDVNEDKLIYMMVGRTIEEMYPRKKITIGEIVLKVKGFTYGDYFKDISFYLRRGEILAIFGLVGSGGSNLTMAIFGANPIDKGELELYGEKVNINEPDDSKRNFIGIVPLERKEHGFFLSLNVANNITVTNIEDLGKNIFISKKLEEKKSKKWIDDLSIKTPSIFTIASSLSGGNQQKLVIAKWLESNSNILILNNPTRGIDVGSKVEIYKIMESLCEKGNSVIMVSSELPEVLGIADRILVMSRGEIVGEHIRGEASKQKILKEVGM